MLLFELRLIAINDVAADAELDPVLELFRSRFGRGYGLGICRFPARAIATKASPAQAAEAAFKNNPPVRPRKKAVLIIGLTSVPQNLRCPFT